MKPLPLRTRVLSALELCPMSTRALATALSTPVASIQHAMYDLAKLSVVAVIGVEAGQVGRPWNVYRIAA